MAHGAARRTRHPFGLNFTIAIKASRPSSVSHAVIGNEPDGGRPKFCGPAAIMALPVVFTFKLTTVLLVPSSVTALGVNVQVPPCGAPEHAKLTAWLNPPSGDTSKSKLAVPPGATVSLVVRGARVKSAPSPESATV